MKVKNPAPGNGPDERPAQPQMTNPVTVHIRKHERVEDCGSFEVWYSDCRPSQYFYFDDVPGRRLRSDQMDRETALGKAKEFARAERDKLKS